MTTTLPAFLLLSQVAQAAPAEAESAASYTTAPESITDAITRIWLDNPSGMVFLGFVLGIALLVAMVDVWRELCRLTSIIWVGHFPGDCNCNEDEPDEPSIPHQFTQRTETTTAAVSVTEREDAAPDPKPALRPMPAPEPHGPDPKPTTQVGSPIQDPLAVLRRMTDKVVIRYRTGRHTGGSYPDMSGWIEAYPDYLAKRMVALKGGIPGDRSREAGAILTLGVPGSPAEFGEHGVTFVRIPGNIHVAQFDAEEYLLEVDLDDLARRAPDSE